MADKLPQCVGKSWSGKKWQENFQSEAQFFKVFRENLGLSVLRLTSNPNSSEPVVLANILRATQYNIPNVGNLIYSRAIECDIDLGDKR
jgi:hypothetical protein